MLQDILQYGIRVWFNRVQRSLAKIQLYYLFCTSPTFFISCDSFLEVRSFDDLSRRSTFRFGGFVLRGNCMKRCWLNCVLVASL